MAKALYGVKKMYVKRDGGLADLGRAYVKTEGGLFGVKKIWVRKKLTTVALPFLKGNGLAKVAFIGGHIIVGGYIPDEIIPGSMKGHCVVCYKTGYKDIPLPSRLEEYYFVEKLFGVKNENSMILFYLFGGYNGSAGGQINLTPNKVNPKITLTDSRLNIKDAVINVYPLIDIPADRVDVECKIIPLGDKYFYICRMTFGIDPNFKQIWCACFFKYGDETVTPEIISVENGGLLLLLIDNLRSDWLICRGRTTPNYGIKKDALNLQGGLNPQELYSTGGLNIGNFEVVPVSDAYIGNSQGASPDQKKHYAYALRYDKYEKLFDLPSMYKTIAYDASSVSGEETLILYNDEDTLNGYYSNAPAYSKAGIITLGGFKTVAVLDHNFSSVCWNGSENYCCYSDEDAEICFL